MAVYLPVEFTDSIRAVLPSSLSFSAFLACCRQPLRRSIRVNTLKITVADFLAQVAPYGWRLTPVPWCAEGFWLDRDDGAQRPLGSVAEHLSGLFYIQEASSMLPVAALLAAALPVRQLQGKRVAVEKLPNLAECCVLDMAAAPGSKTTQLAAAMANRGLLLANEYSGSRMKVLHANISRCGVSNSVLTHLDGRVFGDCLTECFDAILLDAPCSGEGMVRKNADALRGWSPAVVQAMALTQRQLIDSAFRALRPGGTLVYSTCTLNHTENQQVCQYLLERYPGALEILPLTDLFEQATLAATPEGFLHVFPQIYDSEGFFVACLRKTCSVAMSDVQPPSVNCETRQPEDRLSPSVALPSVSFQCQPSQAQPLQRRPSRNRSLQAGRTTEKRSGKPFPFTPVDRLAAEISRAAADIGLCWQESLRLWQRGHEIWLFPSAIDQFIGRLHLSRIGIKLAERHNKGYRWQHEAVIALAGRDNPRAFALDVSQAQQWYQGRDLYPGSLPDSDQLIVSFQGQPVGLAKKVAGRLKNYYPRELVRDGRLFVNE